MGRSRRAAAPPLPRGLPGSRIEGRLGDEAATATGVRLIAIDRPGMGLSDFQLRRALVDWPDDVAQVAWALELDRFSVLGISGGGPYAAACAWKLAARLTGAGIVSHEGEIFLAHPRQGVPVSAEENTRLVHSAYEAFGRGDMAALAEMMADDIEWVDPGDPDTDPNAGTFRGKEAVLGWFGGLASTRDYTTFEPRAFIAQNDKVVSLVCAEATVRDTGRAFVSHEAHVWTFRDGKLARFQSYHDTAAAAAAHRVA
jgi:ketosteroid isomerase-like protein